VVLAELRTPMLAGCRAPGLALSVGKVKVTLGRAPLGSQDFLGFQATRLPKCVCASSLDTRLDHDHGILPESK